MGLTPLPKGAPDSSPPVLLLPRSLEQPSSTPPRSGLTQDRLEPKPHTTFLLATHVAPIDYSFSTDRSFSRSPPIAHQTRRQQASLKYLNTLNHLLPSLPISLSLSLSLSLFSFIFALLVTLLHFLLSTTTPSSNSPSRTRLHLHAARL
ncbi:hypothetical protein FRC12_011869 [Ceratobasidium sp. 428]|nr:hypothetical protein FRC12_011869 [Ceratobasidium sp. 428]